MKFTTQLTEELKQLAGFSSSTPRRIEITDPDGLVLGISVVALSCAFESLTLHVPSLVGNESDVLSAQSNGTFLFRRYRAENGQPGRESVDIHLTLETLHKLVDTIPPPGKE